MNKVGLATAGAVAAIGVVLGGYLLFADEPDSGRAAGPAPTTHLRLDPPPSYVIAGEPPAEDSRYPGVPREQVENGELVIVRTAGRTVYINLMDNDCSRQEAWPRGEYPDRVEVEIRSVPGPFLSSITPSADGEYGCISGYEADDPYAVIELAEPLGDRRLVLKRS